MHAHVFKPLEDAELDEIERYTTEALGYRHQPEFAYECARLIAEVRRLREAQEKKRWSIALFGRSLASWRWPGGAKESAIRG
jgi:hypothetical protein